MNNIREEGTRFLLKALKKNRVRKRFVRCVFVGKKTQTFWGLKTLQIHDYNVNFLAIRKCLVDTLRINMVRESFLLFIVLYFM